MGMRKNHKKNHQRGNAMIYVLIAIALFAALSMTLGRQTDTGEAGDLSDSKAEMYAAQLIAYAAQAKSSVDQMLFSNAKIDELDFKLPGQAGFNTAPNTNKVYHPDGGGLNPGKLPAEAVKQNIGDPVAGWYMGRFNNVEWTKSSGTDVILVAFQIHKKICENINKKITGSTAIPKMSDTIREVLIDDAIYVGATNTDFLTDPAGTPACADCHNRASLCVEDSNSQTYAFYTVIADR
ncbi:MAG: hypothetical protein IT558_06280 [Alphaproteobacteria bacterium]|nr:hypothetical protein [Alphaproteobacteria bacterium]